MKVLMVCLGNICRSPLAEGILSEEVRRLNLNWHTDSAGTSGWHAGEAPDRRSVAEALKHGVDIRQQRSRKVRSTDLAEFDLILAMDAQNIRDLKQFFGPESGGKIRLITEYSRNFKGMDVPDPYYDDDGFAHVYTMLKEFVAGLLEEAK